MASSSASRLSALAPPFTINRSFSQQQLYASSSAMDDLCHENPYAFSSSSMLDSFSGLRLEGTDYDVDFLHHSGMHAAEGSQPFIGTCASLHRDYNENSLGYVVSSSKGPQAARNGGGKEVFQDKNLIEKGKELEDYIFVQSPSTSEDELLHQKAVSDNAGNPLPIEMYDLLVTLPNLTNFTPVLPSTETGVSAKNSSEPFGTYESDLDSPCWKGTLASRKSPFAVEVPGHMNSPPPKAELEVCKSLNPLAPKFIPGNAEGRVGFPIKLIDKKQESIDAVKGGRYSSKTSSEVETLCFDVIHAPRKEHTFFRNSNSSSVHHSTHMIQPTLVEDSFKCKGNFVTGDVGGSVKSIKDAAQNGLSCISYPAVDNVSSSGFTSPAELEGNRQCASESYSVILINDLLKWSELLIQNLSNDFDSLGEQHHDILQNVINNLYVCMRKSTEQRNSVSGSPHPGTYDPRAANEFCKDRYTGLQETRIKAVGNAYWLGDQNGHKKSFSSAFSERDYRPAHPFCSTSDTGIEKGGDVTRVMEKLMKENHETDEELHPQVLLYKNLWLEAEAALCLMKRKACVARMKTQMDESKSN